MSRFSCKIFWIFFTFNTLYFCSVTSDPPTEGPDLTNPGDHRGPRQSGLGRQGGAGLDVLLHDLDLGVHPADGDAARQVDLGLRRRLADRYSLQIQR